MPVVRLEVIAPFDAGVFGTLFISVYKANTAGECQEAPARALQWDGTPVGGGGNPLSVVIAAVMPVLLVAMSCMLTGCAFVGAPSFELFGAFFPAWMLCALLGILGAVGTRVLLTAPTFNDAIVPFQLAVCTAVGVIVALLTWMVLFR